MAISKTQPMRSAEIEILDAVNALDDLTVEHTNSIDALSDGLADEISYREQGDSNLQGQIGEGYSPIHTIAQSLSATNSAISDIEAEIGSGFDSQNTITAYKNTIDAFLGRFRIGIIENITIPANDSVSTSQVFATPFESTDSCIILAQVLTSELSSLFTYTLIDCTYSGFSYSIANSDADSHTVALGYVAIKVN